MAASLKNVRIMAKRFILALNLRQHIIWWLTIWDVSDVRVQETRLSQGDWCTHKFIVEKCMVNYRIWILEDLPDVLSISPITHYLILMLIINYMCIALTDASVDLMLSSPGDLWWYFWYIQVRLKSLITYLCYAYVNLCVRLGYLSIFKVGNLGQRYIHRKANLQILGPSCYVLNRHAVTTVMEP